ncbi:hypothetical protein SFC27_12640 [Bacillus licheniformis]|jgi:hypothetical protein|uniref:Uncharacterized protein n=1 Tax=Bacillus licheniformis TaxID=1402 RepID=A0A8B5YGK4_BACLI|nr:MULTISPECIES: hypothetical protein [Bacillus]MBJ7888270.1 hypothetical protein [Bacillaceae bacterium HSR45]MDP4081681.1 hypothetical protein [Bacillota bacterium]ARC59448.1 hypothetical protein BaDB11_00780 [Bacillus licheniformis]AVI46056.1 hypothetical protein BL14DL4_00795 [Bacillus licheniformis]EQM27579.1 hypothetical protein N399_14305 [Bacillus licheniformis CG-B52]
MEKLPAKTDGRLFLCIKMLFVCNQKDKGTGVQLVFKGLFKGFLVIFQNGIASASENV